MVVNLDPVSPVNMVLTFSDDMLSIGEVDRSTKDLTVTPIRPNSHDLPLSLAAGDGRLFELKIKTGP